MIPLPIQIYLFCAAFLGLHEIKHKEQECTSKT